MGTSAAFDAPHVASWPTQAGNDAPTTPHGRPLLTVLGGLAEFELELIRARTGEAEAAQT
jgi:DNA invertase Pin-like site-specific DNA recombinase